MALKPIPNKSPVDFGNLPVKNFVAEVLSSDPSRVAGKLHYNSTSNLLKYGDNSAVQIVASKAYVDAQVSAAQNNWDYKEVVRFAVNSNVNLSSDLVNGASLGGVTAATGDRVLLIAQTDASENGIYIVAASGAASRSSDADSNAEVTQGLHVEVAEGTFACAAFLLRTANPITLDTTDLSFLQLTGSGTSYSASGDGIHLSGSTFSFVASDIAGTSLEDDGSNNLRIAASAAGNGLQGGGASALSVKEDSTGGSNLAKVVNVSSNGLAVKIDDSTVGENGSGRLFVKNAGITSTQLATSIAGNGLAGGAGTALHVIADSTGGANLAKSVNVSSNGLAVKVDASTINENGSGQLYVPSGALTAAQFASAVAGQGLGIGVSNLFVKVDLTGGANLATSINTSSNGVAIKIDDSTVGVNGSNQLFVKNAGITETQLATSVAGAGLIGGAGTALAVNPDGVTLEINSDAVRVKDLGIGTAKIAANAVTGAKLDSGIFGTGLSFSGGVASVNYSAALYSSTFNNSTDWGSANGDGQYTLTIAAATHGFSTNVLVKQILEDDGTNYVVSPVFYQIVKASGDVQIITSVLFAGKVVLERTA